MLTIRAVSTLGDKLQRLRKGRAYAEIARVAGCSAPTIRDIEAGRTLGPDVRLIARMARFYDVDLNWLVDDGADGDPPVDERGRVVSLIEGALTGAGLTGDLSPDEIELVGRFRRLGPVQKTRLSAYLDGMTEPLTPEAAAQMLQEAADGLGSGRDGDSDPPGSQGSSPTGGSRSSTASSEAQRRPHR